MVVRVYPGGRPRADTPVAVVILAHRHLWETPLGAQEREGRRRQYNILVSCNSVFHRAEPLKGSQEPQAQTTH